RALKSPFFQASRVRSSSTGSSEDSAMALPQRRQPRILGGSVNDQGGGLVRRHRSAEVEALRLVAAQVAEEAQLALVLHALGDHLQAEVVGQGDDGADDGGVMLVAADTADETGVDLELVDRQPRQVGQRRVA